MSRHGVGRNSMAGALRTAHGAVLGRYARPLGEPHRAHVDGRSVAVYEPCESSRANSSWPCEDLLRHGHRGVVDSGPTQSRREEPSRAAGRWSTPCHRPQGPLAPVGDLRPLHHRPPRNRAVRTGEHLVPDGAEQEPGGGAVTAGARHQDLGPLRLAQQHLGCGVGDLFGAGRQFRQFRMPAAQFFLGSRKMLPQRGGPGPG